MATHSAQASKCHCFHHKSQAFTPADARRFETIQAGEGHQLKSEKGKAEQTRHPVPRSQRYRANCRTRQISDILKTCTRVKLGGGAKIGEPRNGTLVNGHVDETSCGLSLTHTRLRDSAVVVILYQLAHDRIRQTWKTGWCWDLAGSSDIHRQKAEENLFVVGHLWGTQETRHWILVVDATELVRFCVSSFPGIYRGCH